MPYNGNIPQPNDQLSQSQLDLLNNFSSILTWANVNHVNFDLPDQGKHKWVSFPIQSVAPATLATELALYTKNVSGLPQLFLRLSSSGNEINLTSSVQAATGFATLPSGIIAKWGQSGNITGTGTFIIPVVAGIPAFTAPPFLVLFTLINSNVPAAAPYWIPLTTTNLAIGFTMSNTLTGLSTTANVVWLALGI